MPEPVTMMRTSGRTAFKLAIMSNRVLARAVAEQDQVDAGQLAQVG